MQRRRIGAFLLFIFSAAAAIAGPGGQQSDARNAVRAYQIQEASIDRGHWQDPSRVQPQPESPRVKEQGRMTPEERRTLRRQINEVGHDIYSPK